jgi:hypothetical protein
MEAPSTLLARLAIAVARPAISAVNATSRMSPMASLHLLLLPMQSLPLLFPPRLPMPLLPSFPLLFLLNRSRRGLTILHDDLWTWCRHNWSSCLHDCAPPAFLTFSFLVKHFSFKRACERLSDIYTAFRPNPFPCHHHHLFFFLEPMCSHDLPTTCEKFYHEIPTMMFIISFSLLYQHERHLQPDQGYIQRKA